MRPKLVPFDLFLLYFNMRLLAYTYESSSSKRYCNEGQLTDGTKMSNARVLRLQDSSRGEISAYIPP